MNKAHTIEIKDQKYKIADLPPDIQQLIEIFQEWELEQTKLKKEMFKLEAAIKTLSNELELRVSNIQ